MHMRCTWIKETRLFESLQPAITKTSQLLTLCMTVHLVRTKWPTNLQFTHFMIRMVCYTPEKDPGLFHGNGNKSFLGLYLMMRMRRMREREQFPVPAFSVTKSEKFSYMSKKGYLELKVLCELESMWVLQNE